MSRRGLLSFSLAALLAAAAVASTEPVVQGRVLGPGGQPVEGATVRVLPAPPDTVVVLSTDAAGTFRASGLAGDSFRVFVEAPGLAPFSRAEVPAGTSLPVELAPGHALTGRAVQIETGRPVAGAEVLACGDGAQGFGDAACRATRTDEQGRFRLAGLAPGRPLLKLRADGRAHTMLPVTVPAEVDPETGEPRPVEAVLRPGGRVSGRVVDRAGRPVEGAGVRVRSTGPGTDPAEHDLPPATRSDADGAFDLRGIPAGPPLALVASRSGYQETRHQPLAVETGEHVADLRLVLSAGATLAVRLLDEAERPVTTVAGRLYPEEPGHPAADRGIPLDRKPIDSTADGVHTLRNLPVGRFRLELTLDDFEPVEREDVRLREGATRDLGTIVLRAGHGIRGRVIDADGDPVAGAPVSATWSHDDRFVSRRKATDEEGSFRFAGITEEHVRKLRVDASGFATYERERVPVDGDELEIVLERSAAVTGRVLLPDGEPVTSFTVAVHREATESSAEPLDVLDGSRTRESFSEADGRFTLEGLDPGTVTLETSAENWAPGRKTGLRLVSGRTVDAGSIRLREGLMLRGRVVEGDVGTPVPGTAVSARRPADLLLAAARHPGRTTISDAEGSFVLRGLEPGTLAVRAEHAAFSPVERRVELEEGAILDDLVLRLSQGGRLTGVVLDADGVAVAGAMILLMQGMELERGRDSTTGADGRYLIDRLEPGAYLVALAPRERTLRGAGMKTASIREGETTVVDFIESEGVRLSGQVLRGETPLGGALLTFIAGIDGGSLMAEGVGIKATQSDETGRYEIHLDEPGEYQVIIGDPSGPGPQNAVRIVVPEEPEVFRNIILRAHRIAGFVTDDAGRPVGGATLEARPGSAGPMDFSGQSAAVSDDTGAYALEGLEPGTYRVVAHAEGLAGAERYPVEVVEGTVQLDLVLERGRRLRGLVTDEAGRPVGGAVVMAVRSGAGNDAVSEGARTDVNGVFELKVPGDEPLDVTAMARGWAPALVRGVVPAPDPEAAPLRIVLTAGGRVRVTVLDAAGAPVKGVQVVARSLTPSLSDFLRAFQSPPMSDAGGIAWIESLAPGGYELSVPGGHGVAPIQVTVDEGQVSEATIRLPDPDESGDPHDHHH